jgi:DNA gyrase subunit A
MNTEYHHGEIKKISISKEMKKSYLDYAMSVIVARAIPDVCDGLKPVHRRILYAMYESNCDYNKPFKKSARIVGEVMGKYHPHGDTAIYESLVRMAQDFSMNVPLVDGQGNFGSIDDDPPAAMRYTESRMQKISHTMLEDLDKDTVDFVPNYDGTEEEPKVLPARFPNLLVNGSSGIAVGMATNIPPHNLGEIIDGVITYINNPTITVQDLLQIIPGPDFPTFGEILGKAGYVEAANTGRGSITMRGQAKIEELKNGKSAIIFTSVPYQVNKAKLVEKIAELVKEKKIEGISDLRDESGKDGIRIFVELKKDAISDVVLNQLYNYTSLQTNFPMNMLALNYGKPEQLNLLDVIRIFTNFRKTVVTRRINYLLAKTRDRAHLLIGLRVAVNQIDEIIALIKSSPDTATAKTRLLERSWDGSVVAELIKIVQDKGNKIDNGKFYFTETQARAILDMKLAKLTGLESEKITKELEELGKLINEYLSILSDEVKLMNIIKDELIAIKNEFAVPRKTVILEQEAEVDVEDLIPQEDMVIITTMKGYIKRVPLTSYRAQRRGGKGKLGIVVQDEDYTTDIYIANTHTPILFFSTKGKVYKMKTYKLPLGTSHAKGRAVINLFPLDANETISTILVLTGEKEEWLKKNIIFATKKGNIRRNSMMDFERIQANGKIAIKLKDDDELVNVSLCDDDIDVMLSSEKGKCIRFPLDSLRMFKGRNSSGVRGIKLDAFNNVISMSILTGSDKDKEIRDWYLKIPVESRIKLKEKLAYEESIDKDSLLNKVEKPLPVKIDKEIVEKLTQEIIEKMALNEEFILTITENGFGKRTSTYEYRTTNRGGVGITNIITSQRNGNVVASFPVIKDEQVIMITDKGTVIRTKVFDIRISGRNTQGVTLMKAQEEKVVSVARIENEEEE